MLPDLHTRKMVALDVLVLTRDGMVRGEPLGQHVKTGDLSRCYEFYFGPDGSGKSRYRLVHSYSPGEVTAIAIEAVAESYADIRSPRTAMKRS